MPEGLYDIQPVRVTSRSADKLIKPFGIGENTIRALPKKGVVVEIGSGLHQELATWIKGVRDDVTTVSIDPTLTLRQSKDNPLLLSSDTPPVKPDFMAFAANESRIDEVDYKTLGKEPQSVVDQDDAHISLERIQEGQRIHSERIIEASKKGGVAAIAPAIPLKEGSADLLIDSYAAGTHYCTDQEKTNEYYKEIIRLLKSGGKAYVFPIDTYADFVSKLNDAERNTKAKESVNSALKDFADINVEFFEFNVNGENNRVGIKISKKEQIKATAQT